jgi:drug/metabolite transporter (DMT)-like permease
MMNPRISIVLCAFTLASLGAQHTAHAFLAPITQRLCRSHTLPKTRHGASPKPDEMSDGVETNNRGTIGTFDPFQYANDEAAPTRHTLAESNDMATTEDIQQMGIWAARALLLFVAMLWGTNFAAVKYLETLCFHPPCNHPPSQAAFARFGVAALVSLPLLIGQRKDIILAGLECGLWVTLGYITQAMALEYIPSGQCAFICSLTVVTVPLFAYFIYGKPLKGINFISALIALTGVGVLEGVIDVHDLVGMKPAIADTSTAILASATTEVVPVVAAATAEASSILGDLAKGIGISKGDLLALGQPLGFGLSFMRIEYYVEKFKDTPNRILTISAAQCLAVGFCSLLWLLYDFHGTIPNFQYMVRGRIIDISSRCSDTHVHT